MYGPAPQFILAVSGLTSTSVSVSLTYTVDNDPRMVTRLPTSFTTNSAGSPVLLLTVSEPISVAKKADRQAFTLLINQKATGLLTLDTYEDDTPCNPWDKLSELRFNGQMIKQDANYQYPIQVTL